MGLSYRGSCKVNLRTLCPTEFHEVVRTERKHFIITLQISMA